MLIVLCPGAGANAEFLVVPVNPDLANLDAIDRNNPHSVEALRIAAYRGMGPVVQALLQPQIDALQPLLEFVAACACYFPREILAAACTLCLSYIRRPNRLY